MLFGCAEACALPLASIRVMILASGMGMPPIEGSGMKGWPCIIPAIISGFMKPLGSIGRTASEP